MTTASLCLAALPFFALGTAVPTPTTLGYPLQIDLQPTDLQVIALTNAERVRYGLRPLKMDMQLIRSARRHASWMTRNRSLQHAHTAAAENIAMGQSTPREVVAGWMHSPGHRANILSGQYSRIGVAACVTPEGTIYWCQQFLP